MSRPKLRKIIHVDMDCFYAAVEMRDDPSLAKVPLAVGGRADRRGVLSTCNYIAREYGVHSAMATAYALRLCPELKVIPGRMSYYQEISKQIRAIFRRYTDVIEPLSLDEAFLDVTDSRFFGGSATLIARDIRESISREVNLTASAGIAPNKFIAKICSDENKPNGQLVITPAEVASFIRQLPLSKIPGVGKVTLERLAKLGLNTCADVRQWPQIKLETELGSLGQMLYKRCRGVDDRPLTTRWIRKSLSVERTFAQDILELSGCNQVLQKLFDELSRRLDKHASRPIKNQQIKLKFSDFRSTTLERQSKELSLDLFRQILPLAWERGDGKGIRLLGLGVNFDDNPASEEHKIGEPSQLDLF